MILNENLVFAQCFRNKFVGIPVKTNGGRTPKSANEKHEIIPFLFIKNKQNCVRFLHKLFATVFKMFRQIKDSKNVLITYT